MSKIWILLSQGPNSQHDLDRLRTKFLKDWKKLFLFSLNNLILLKIPEFSIKIIKDDKIPCNNCITIQFLYIVPAFCSQNQTTRSKLSVQKIKKKYLSIYLSIYHCFYRFVCWSILNFSKLRSFIYVSIYLSIYLILFPLHLSIYLSIYLSICLPISLFICWSIPS